MRTYDEMISGLKDLKKQGFVKTHRHGPTGIGKTLEDLLDIEENNFPGPDGKDTELKSARKKSASMLTLFTKSPLPRGINTKFRLEYAKPDENFPNSPLALRSTIDSRGFNKFKGEEGFKIITEDDKVKIVSARKPVKFPEMPEPYWPKEMFEKSIRKKYKKSLLYVKADTKGSEENEMFHYNEAYLLQGFDFEKFSKNLGKGILKIDIRLGLYPNGKYHDHGTGVRIMPSKLELCFSGEQVL